MSTHLSHDVHSHARHSEARTTHLALDLVVDFERRVLSGTASLDVEPAPGVRWLVLDTNALAVSRVSDAEGRPLAFELGPADALLGTPLRISLPEGCHRAVVHYATSPSAPGLQWLEPSQTAGGAQPFLFTQGHAILTRSYIPLQDSAANRITYEARITVPELLVALMSAERLGAHPGEEGRVHAFRMNEPIPPHLIALAVGDLVMRELGSRTAVFAEPSTIDAAAHEFAEMEAMVEAAESMLGPYLWGRFDVLVMPPSFPYGGMENPRLVFASPTLLAGDRSLVTVVAHELAHAWAGNLVVNALHDDFWLNEGPTVYVELRLNEALWGEARAAFLKETGFRELEHEIARIGETSPDTRLHYDMSGRDPAEGVTVVPYLKGAAFFWSLEARVGRERLDAWFRGWFERKAFQSVTSDELLDDLRSHLFAGEAASIDLERWVHEPGLLEEAKPPPSALGARLDDAAKALLEGSPASSIDASGWSPQAWRHFLGTLLAAQPSAALVAELNLAFALSQSKNCEVLAPWLCLRAQVEDASAEQAIVSFLGSVGRMKYLRPLYAELLATAWGRPIAKRAREAAQPKYHALVRAGLERLFAASATRAG
jgi:aminopeptidase N